MKKTILIIASCVVLFVVAGLMACGQQEVETVEGAQEAEYTETIHTRSMFVVVEETYYYDVVYHRETKVMYTMSGDCGAFTLLVNPDGTPMIWEG